MKGIKKRILLVYFPCLVLLVLLAEAGFLFMFQQYQYASIHKEMRGRASAAAAWMAGMDIDKNDFSTILGKSYREMNDNMLVEIQFFDKFGRMRICTSGFFPDDYYSTPDLLEALNGKESSWQGNNYLTDEKILAVSMPVFDKGSVTGVLRYVTSMTGYEKDFYAVLLESLGVVLFIIIIVFLTMVIFIGSLINPLRTINDAAGQIAHGDLSVRIDKKFNDEIGELAATVNYMANELQKLDVMKTDFISAVSHELRTPLTSIRGWSETLMTAPPDEKELRLGLSVISKETERLSRMVGELLDFSRLEAGRLIMNMDKVELVSILAEVIRIFSASFAEKKMLLSQDIRVDSIMLLCDADRIRQVIINILDNVLKFCNEGGTVRIILQSLDGYAEMIIEDNGPGISPEDLPRVKEKFYKGKSTRPGSGIGLGICDEIIRLHNGILTVTSEVDNGTQVKIKLPLSDNK